MKKSKKRHAKGKMEISCRSISISGNSGLIFILLTIAI